MRLPSPLPPNARLEYIRSVVAREPTELAAIRARIAERGDLPIHISPEEGRLLQVMIRCSGYRRVVEIGTHAGYSTMFMASALPEDGHIITLEKDPKRIMLARETFASAPPHLASKITLMEGDAMESLSKISSSRGQDGVDLVFIDADKLNYGRYLDWAEQNVRQGGLVVGDNTFLHGAVCGGEEEARARAEHRISASALLAMRQFNQRLGDPAKFCSVMLPTSEGWTMGVKL